MNLSEINPKDLKPCPFCGGAEIGLLRFNCWAVVCERCGAQGLTVLAWNCRAPIQVTDEMCAAALAAQQGVNIKTHPGWADAENWGQHRISAMRAALDAALSNRNSENSKDGE